MSVCKPAQIVPQVRPAQSATRHDFLLILLCISTARVLTSESCQQLPLGNRPHLNVHSRTNPPGYASLAPFPLLLSLLALSSAVFLIQSASLGALRGKAFVVLLKLQNARGGEEYRS